MSKPTLDYIAEALRPLALPIGELRPHPENPRKHRETDLAATASSLDRFGQRRPVLVNASTGYMLTGHGRLEAAKRLGWSHLAVVFVELDASAAAGYMIADNRVTELGEWDTEQLAAWVAELDGDDPEFAELMRMADLVELGPELETSKAGGGGGDKQETEAAGETFHLIVECDDETSQRRLYEAMRKAGREIKLQTI